MRCPNRAQRRLWPFWGLAALLAGLVWGCRDQAPSGAGDARAIRSVHVLPLSFQKLDRTIAVLGSLLPYQEAVLSAKVDGRLEVIMVDIGSEVKAGQVLAQVETRDYELRLRQAEAALAQARARLGLDAAGATDVVNLTESTVVREAQAVLDEARAARERVARLTEANIASSSELETVEAAYQVAVNRFESAQDEVRQRLANLQQRRVELEIARQQLNDTRITAPFDGVIQVRRASPGHFLQPGDPVLTLVQVKPLRLRMEVPEVQSSRIALNQQVRFTLTGSTQVRTGKLERISPALQTQNRMLIVEADVANDGGLHPGTFAETEIVVEQAAPVLATPVEALRVFAGIEKILVEEKGVVAEKDVVTGERSGPWVEIKSGLEEGDRVILEPAGLRSGQAVQTSS